MTERMRSNDDRCECGHSYAWHYNCYPGHYTGSYAAGACGACDCASFWDAAPWTPEARGLLVAGSRNSDRRDSGKSGRGGRLRGKTLSGAARPREEEG